MVPAEGSEPLNFKSVYAVSSSLQARTCMERAVMQVHAVQFCIQALLKIENERTSCIHTPSPKEGGGGSSSTPVDHTHVRCPIT